MSFKSGVSNQDTSNTSTFTPDSTLLGDLYGNFDRAEGVANTPFQPYSGQQVAGFTPDQTQAQDAYADLADDQVGAAPLNSAVDTAQGVAGYAPQTITAPQLSAVNLSAYMNPYQSEVINSTLADMARQQQIQTQANSSQATQAGAFGGSRSAVLQNLSDDSYDRAVASTAASLDQANYSQAQSAAQSDIANQMAAAQANQSAGLQGANLNLSAANSLAGLGNDQLSQALQYAGALNTAGTQQQQNQQAQLDAAYQQWLLAQQYPLTMQNLLNSTIQTIPDYGTTTSNGTQTGTTDQEGLDIGSLAGGVSKILPFAMSS